MVKFSNDVDITLQTLRLNESETIYHHGRAIPTTQVSGKYTSKKNTIEIFVDVYQLCKDLGMDFHTTIRSSEDIEIFLAVLATEKDNPLLKILFHEVEHSDLYHICRSLGFNRRVSSMASYFILEPSTDDFVTLSNLDLDHITIFPQGLLDNSRIRDCRSYPYAKKGCKGMENCEAFKICHPRLYRRMNRL